MRKPKQTPTLTLNLVLIIGLAFVWLAFAPVQLGGQVSYVLVNGISMEPLFHKGDLVIVRIAPVYNVGDVVTYKEPNLKANVIHRIINIEQGKYIFKGDNNSWIDPYHAKLEDIIGKKWLFLPKFGNYLLWLRTPLHMALIVALTGGIIMASMYIQPQKNRKRKNKPAGNSTSGFEIALYTFGFLGLACLALTIYAFTRPLQQKGKDIGYTQKAVFSYTANGSPRIYDSGNALSGEPVFLKLTCKLNLGFTYTIEGPQPLIISGHQNLSALLQDKNSGWQRTIPITSAMNFRGSSATTQATFDLCQLNALIAQVKQETGIRTNSYTLSVMAHVAVSGMLAGQDIVTTFDPKIDFNFDSLYFYPASNSSGTDPFLVNQPGTLSNPQMDEKTLSLFGLKPTVRNTRTLAGSGLGISLVGLLVLGWLLFKAAKYTPTTLIRLKYGTLISEVYGKELLTVEGVNDVASIDELAKIANRLSLMIFHLSPRPRIHYYFVKDNQATYRFVMRESPQVIKTRVRKSIFSLLRLEKYLPQSRKDRKE